MAADKYKGAPTEAAKKLCDEGHSMTWYPATVRTPGRWRCKPCASVRACQWAKDNPDKVSVKQRRSRTWVKYGLSEEQVHEMYLAQGGCCAICGDGIAAKRAIDHCHETGRVRGLLCHPCNRGLGDFRDDIACLARAIEYLTIGGPHGD